MSSIYNRLYTVYENVLETTDSTDRGSLLECPNIKDYTYEEGLKAVGTSSCSCKIFHYSSSNIIETLYASTLFHRDARNYFSRMSGQDGHIKIIFHLKKTSTVESFKAELLLKFKVFTCKILNGWEEVKTLSESETTTYQKENNSSDIKMFFKSIVCQLFPTFEGDEKDTVIVKQVGNHLTLKGYKFHILQMFDSVHPLPPVRVVTATDQKELVAYYNHEIARLSSVRSLDAQKWRLNCLGKLFALLKE